MPGIFGRKVFNDETMQKYLSKRVYKIFAETVNEGRPLSREIGEIVADAMKKWAIENGATHFTHWFQPLTGITAEKHDSFIKLLPDGKVIMNFSVKELIKGEPDASSFPSGGLRATFEARGYTAWDPTSYAFIKNNSLYVPTLFCSYGGEILDEKTPLLKSMEAINRQSMRILRLLGNKTSSKVSPMVGAEQEYFLVDKKDYSRRKDLIFCGRTLFGAQPVKGQDISNHYFGAIRPRVWAFMEELDFELWKLGVPVKTKHNEVAPSQHELSQIHTVANLATDQNQIIMETLKSIAEHHELVCLLHEKPFHGINGSGKHNNWSLVTDAGINLLDPGKSPQDNMQFLIFLCAIIKAIDDYSDLLRMSVASAGNDCRLGSQEAPPAVVSVYVGDEIIKILEAIEKCEVYSEKEEDNVKIGLNILPFFPRDTSDRNRTSPFAFTGNKFEFRMVGSNQSIAWPNTVLNTIVADALGKFADELSNSGNLVEKCNSLLVSTIKNHKKIISNGNNYSDGWADEAKERGLYNFENAVDALESYISEKNINLFKKHNILTEKEITSRYEIQLENYCKTIRVEADTAVNVVRKEILPSITFYVNRLCETVLNKNKISDSNLDCSYEINVLKKLSDLSGKLYRETEELNIKISNAGSARSLLETAKYYKNIVLQKIESVRKVADEIELNMSKTYWPFPTYEEILFSV
jgi:glutamine synthetase